MNLKQKLSKLNTLTNSFDNNDKKASNSKRLNTEEDNFLDNKNSFRFSEKNSLLILEEESPVSKQLKLIIELLTPIKFVNQTPKALSNLDLSFVKNGVRIKRLSIK